MFGSGGEAAGTQVLERLAGLVDELQTLDLTTLPDDDLLSGLRELETQKRRLAAVDHRLIAEAGSRGLAREHACKNTATLLGQLLRVSPVEASSRVRAAADLGPRRGLTGETLPPLFQIVAAAQAAGAISARHAQIITRAIDALPAAVQAEHEDSVQDFLVEQARQFDPRLLAQVAHRISDTLDPDGTYTSEHDRARRRDLTIRQRPDGSSHVEGELTAICTQALLTVLDTLARPVPALDGARDPRTAGQRNHDAVQDAMLMLLRTDLLPDCGGVAATILLTMTAEQIADRPGHHRPRSPHLHRASAHPDRRRPDHPGRTRQDQTDHRLRQRPPDLHRGPAPGHDRPRPRLLIPRLHRTTRLVPGASRHRLRPHPTNLRRRRHTPLRLSSP